VTILQLAASNRASFAAAMAPDDGRFRAREHLALARVLATRRGPLADRLLTPWAAWLPSSRVGPAHDDRSLLDRAAQLSAQVAASTGSSVADLRDILASGDGSVPDGQLDARHLAAAIALIADADALAAGLAERGLIPCAAAFWWQDDAWLAEAAAATTPPLARRGAVDRWDALRFGIARAEGVRYSGLPASPGRATGRPHWVSGPEDTAALEPGDILIVDHPVPALAPFLWDRGGMVAATGSPGSHLCEVARSIHVPMVVGVALPERPGLIVAVDGDTGDAWIWEP
jgi:phosphohistidine swiveling domain-containing protein